MNSIQANKLEKYKSKLLARKQHQQALKTITETVDKHLQSINGEIVDKIEVINNVTVTGLEDVAKAIEKIEQPVPVVNVTAPEVKVSPNIKIEPAIVNEDVYARYKRVNSSVEPDGIYHGFVNKAGNWFIQRETENPNETEASSRYTAGATDFKANWNKRKYLDYVTFDEVDIK